MEIRFDHFRTQVLNFEKVENSNEWRGKLNHTGETHAQRKKKPLIHRRKREEANSLHKAPRNPGCPTGSIRGLICQGQSGGDESSN